MTEFPLELTVLMPCLNEERFMSARASPNSFSAAVESGMRTLKMDGMQKIMLGLTDLKQVRSVCIK